MIAAIALASIVLAGAALLLPAGPASLLLPSAVAAVNLALLVAEVRQGGVRRTVLDVGMTVLGPASWVPSAFAVVALPQAVPPAWWWVPAAVALVLLADATQYLVHLACHTVPMLWRVHEVHHRPAHVSVFTRAWADPLDPTFWPLVPCAALATGVPVQVVVSAQLLTLTALAQHCAANLHEPSWKLLLASHHLEHHRGGGQPVNLAPWSSWPDRIGGTYR